MLSSHADSRHSLGSVQLGLRPRHQLLGLSHSGRRAGTDAVPQPLEISLTLPSLHCLPPTASLSSPPLGPVTRA